MMLEIIKNFAFIQVGGLSMVALWGLFTFLLISITAYIGFTNYKGAKRIPFRWHPRIASLTFVVATIHLVLAISRSL